MNGNLAVTNINQIITEIKKITILNENKKRKYIKNKTDFRKEFQFLYLTIFRH